MTTAVGTQEDFIEALKALLELDYDAVEAYEVAIKNIEKQEYKDQLNEFKEDHKCHIKELSAFLAHYEKEVPTGPDHTKQYLVVGKVKLASVFGDLQILKAMLSNEEDTNTAYERINSRPDEFSYPEIARIITNGLRDEKRHKEWLANVVEKIKASA